MGRHRPAGAGGFEDDLQVAYTTHMPSLKWIASEGRPRVFPVFKQITSIGSAATNDITISSEGITEFQAQIVFDGREFNLVEMDSSGKLLINGKKKRRGKIYHNDKLRLGSANLVFSIYDEFVSGPNFDEETLPMQAELAGMVKLSDFNQRLMQLDSLPEQLRTLLDAVIEVTDAQKGFVILLRDGEPEVTIARNVDGQELNAGISELSDSILKRVVEARRPIIVSDAMHDAQFRTAESVINLQLSSVMCAPLIARGQLLGLIYVGNDDVISLFDDSSLNVLTIFAGQASLILQNALLLDEVSTDRERMARALADKRFGEIIGSCKSLTDMFRKIGKVATTDISVLITGETGTGKELIARELHRNSRRKQGPFIVVNCGAIPENLMESELFGHVRGAFTGAVATRKGKFQLAHEGTLFLDEIGEMPLGLQVKLLRALQERVVIKIGDTKPERVDIRVLAATNRNLEQEIDSGNFREDLFYRLNVVNLHVPPLRERGDDVAVLAKFLLKKYADEYGSTVRGFTPNAIIAIRKYEWPGNVRQLENRLKKAIVLCEKSLVGPEDLDLLGETSKPIESLSTAREEFTRRYILEVLEQNGGNRTKTARDLDVDPRTIFRYLERETNARSPKTVEE
ncbi:MAG: sigma 54-interacting transcriptional regulator [Myxococcota bacterium]